VADAAPTEEFVELPGGRVHLLRAGTGEPVLFLHAAGGAGVWHPFHQGIADAGFEVLAPDHPGFGKSDEFPEAEAIDDLVYHYLDVMDALGLTRPHVVGASFGGWIAAELAVHSPHRIGSLTLLSAAGLRIPEHPVTDIFLLPPAKLVATLYHDPPDAPLTASPDAPPDLDAVIAAYREATSLARFSWVPYLSDPKLERRLGRITAPTLVVAPADDRLIPVEHAKRYAARIPGAAYAEVPDCGHAMYFERPAEFAAVVTRHLSEHSLSAHPLAAAESGASR
jgi:pimeloyl-ACP methyl ester carboxylesterase